MFGNYVAKGLFSEANAKAIKRRGEELPCKGRVDVVRIDPAATANTGIGIAAYAEFERVFGSRFLARSPHHLVVDGLDQIEVLLDQGNLLIHPRCQDLKAAFQNYRRAQRGGEWLNQPAADQSPHEDSMDALRYGIRSRFPEGRRRATGPATGSNPEATISETQEHTSRCESVSPTFPRL